MEMLWYDVITVQSQSLNNTCNPVPPLPTISVAFEEPTAEATAAPQS